MTYHHSHDIRFSNAEPNARYAREDRVAAILCALLAALLLVGGLYFLMSPQESTIAMNGQKVEEPATTGSALNDDNEPPFTTQRAW